MRKILIIFTLSILILTSTAYAQEKQKACLAPMGALGDISEMQKQIIFNSLQESLSTQYILASKKTLKQLRLKLLMSWNMTNALKISALP